MFAEVHSYYNIQESKGFLYINDNIIVACEELTCYVSADDMKCMSDAGSKNGDDLGKHCAGVDFDLLKARKVSINLLWWSLVTITPQHLSNISQLVLN